MILNIFFTCTVVNSSPEDIKGFHDFFIWLRFLAVFFFYIISVSLLNCWRIQYPIKDHFFCRNFCNFEAWARINPILIHLFRKIGWFVKDCVFVFVVSFGEFTVTKIILSRSKTFSFNNGIKSIINIPNKRILLYLEGTDDFHKLDSIY